MSLKNLSARNRIPKILSKKFNNKRIKLIYKKFEKTLNINENFIVAVSGGADSLALAFLSKIYSIKKNITSRFFIVDHKLRPNSTLEAKKVKKILKMHFINADILTWKGKKPQKNIQSLARKKRYDLLFAECNKLKIKDILLGHHQDDVMENFFIRMLRGSGLKGLISLDKKTQIEDKNLIRPLLKQKKNDLTFVSKHVFNFYVKDPSNEDEKYQRIRIRKLIKQLQMDGLDKEKFENTINNLRRSNKVINFYVKENIEKNSFFSVTKKTLTLNKEFFEQPYEVIFRSFSDLIKLVGNKYYSVRGKKLDRIIDEIGNKKHLKVTLGGCIIENVNHTVIISKEC